MAPGEPGFDQAYQAAINGEVAAHPQSKTSAGTLEWLVARYRETSAWTELSLATRRQREAIFRQILATAGREPIARITRKAVVAGRDRRRDTPAQARHYLDAMRGLFRWAVDADLCKDDPTADVRPPKAKRSDGFPVWEPEDVAKFESRWPIGTRARLAFDLLRYTGLRRGDAARLGKQHVRDGVIRIKTSKTGQLVTITMLPALAETLAAGPVGDLAFIVGDRGRPLTKESFGNEFREWCAAAGVTKSAHGLRKLAATIMAENGATVPELESVFGWSGGRMASHYTRSADRERLGRTGSVKLARTETTRSDDEGEIRRIDADSK
ncbi:tyrosine-type recombinase/integrase [Rhodoplanes roseus]|uniref:tyrosine-type recombinase/integrase n=1 Tax=Rhodoplanes roseus TaxID=29409 RepID=UPI001FDF4BB7|nr:tyrosine-type recombinase/integrase [Rhodoplanes roseus]